MWCLFYNYDYFGLVCFSGRRPHLAIFFELHRSTLPQYWRKVCFVSILCIHQLSNVFVILFNQLHYEFWVTSSFTILIHFIDALLKDQNLLLGDHCMFFYMHLHMTMESDFSFFIESSIYFVRISTYLSIFYIDSSIYFSEYRLIYLFFISTISICFYIDSSVYFFISPHLSIFQNIDSSICFLYRLIYLFFRISISNHRSVLDDPGLFSAIMTWEQLTNIEQMRWGMVNYI